MKWRIVVIVLLLTVLLSIGLPESSSEASSWTRIWSGSWANPILDEQRNIMYAMKDTSVWRCKSPDASPSWVEIGQDLPENDPRGIPCEVCSITCDEVHDVLYASCQWDGVWRGDNPDSSPTWTPGIEGSRALNTIYDEKRNMLYVDQWRFYIGRVHSPNTSPVSNPIVTIDGRSFYYAHIISFDETRNILYLRVVFEEFENTYLYLCKNPDSSPSFTRLEGWPSINEPVLDEVNNIIYAVSDDNRLLKCKNPNSSPTWSEIGVELSGYDISSLEYDSVNNALYVGTDNGIWSCCNPNTSSDWINVGGSEIDMQYGCDVLCDPQRGYLYVAAYNGIWRTNLTPAWRSDIQTGDILLHRTGGILSGVGLFYTHAGIYVGNGMVAEACPQGVNLYPIENWDYPRDTYVTLCRVNATEAKREAAAAWARNQTRRIPRPTYGFALFQRSSLASSPSWYCSELVWASYYSQGIDLAVRGGVGLPVASVAVSPDHLATDDQVTIVDYHYEFCPGEEQQGMVVRADCPVDLSLIDPGGNNLSKEKWEIRDAYYVELDLDEDGEKEDIIALEDRKLGDYRVGVAPEAGASPDDTYNLQAFLAGERITLARDVKVSDIPDKGYRISAPEKTWYLAEGATAGDFQTWILVQNPGPELAHIRLTFMTESGLKPGPQADLDPGHRISFLANTYATSYNLSTRIESDSPVVCERAMYGGGGNWAHDSVGVTSPSTTWYLAEGCTAPGFQTWVLVQNPGSDSAHVKLTFMTESGPKPGPQADLDPGSRISFDCGRHVTSYNLSTKVESDNPVVCERAMYGSDWSWAHDSVGVTTPATTWYLAEGSTGGGMQTFILVQNPGGGTASVDIAYMTTSGRVPGPHLEIPAGSRRTVNASDTCPNNYDVSTLVTSNKPVIAERAMYGPGWSWAHDSVGVTAPASTWYLPEGCIDGGMDTFVLVQNPSASRVHVNLLLQTDTGEGTPTGLGNVAIPAYSRKTIHLNQYYTSYNLSTLVTCDDGQVICERAMYGGGMRWGHDSCGYRP